MLLGLAVDRNEVHNIHPQSQVGHLSRKAFDDPVLRGPLKRLYEMARALREQVLRQKPLSQPYTSEPRFWILGLQQIPI